MVNPDLAIIAFGGCWKPFVMLDFILTNSHLIEGVPTQDIEAELPRLLH
jgi:hypothetical protein